MTEASTFVTTTARLTQICLAVAGIVALLAFADVFYHYGWTGDRRFSSSFYAGLYYGGPIAVSALLLASLRLRAAYQANLLTVLVSLIVSLYGLEALVQSRYSFLPAQSKPVMSLLEDSTDKKKDAARLTKDWGVEIDTRTATEVINDLRHTGVDAVPFVAPSNRLFLTAPTGSLNSYLSIEGREVVSLAGVSNKVTLLCNESGQWIDYKSDQRGFNNASEMWQSDRLQIAAVGDSFTQGLCVPAERNFVALIRQHYPGTLNLGIAGDGPLFMLATLAEYVPPFKPPIVLWFYFEGNDLIELQKERHSVLLRSYLNADFTQRDLARQHDIDRALMNDLPRMIALERANWTRRHTNSRSGWMDFATLSVLRQRSGLVGGVDPTDGEQAADFDGPNIDAFREVMARAQSRVGAWGGQLVFVYLPEWATYTRAASWGKAKRADVLASVRNLGIPLIDIGPAFQGHADPLSLFPFRGSGHYNDMGHQLVADTVLKALSGSGLLVTR